MCVCVCVCVRTCTHKHAQSCPTLCDHIDFVAHQVPQSMGFSRQEYWSGLPFPCPGDLSDPGMEPASPALAGGFFSIEPPGKSPSRPFIGSTSTSSAAAFADEIC